MEVKKKLLGFAALGAAVAAIVARARKRGSTDSEQGDPLEASDDSPDLAAQVEQQGVL